MALEIRNQRALKWLSFMGLLVAGMFMIGQKNSLPDDSPARYGCRIWVTEGGKLPQTGDSNAGIGPDEKDEGDYTHRDILSEIRDAVPQSPQVRPTEAPMNRILVNQYEVFKLGANSPIGRLGDYVIDFQGSGFIGGEGTPVVHIGDTVHLHNSHVGANGNRLMVVLPAELADSLAKLEWRGMSIQNPGGLDRDRARWSRMPMLKAALVNRIREAPTRDLMQGEYFLQWK